MRRRNSVLLALGLVAMFASLLAAQAAPLNRGNFVLITGGQNQLAVKTIVAVPGDTVSIAQGQVSVNGNSTSLIVSGVEQWGPRLLSDGTFFVAGDPLQLGGNSAGWGMVPMTSIVATVQRIQ